MKIVCHEIFYSHHDLNSFLHRQEIDTHDIINIQVETKADKHIYHLFYWED